MTLEISDLDTIKDTALKTFEERLAKASLEDRAGMEREASRLESQLEQLYSFTALMARREPDMAKTEELWARFVRICDLFAGRVYQLSQEHALSSAAYDNILDIRSAAEELRALHSRPGSPGTTSHDWLSSTTAMPMRGNACLRTASKPAASSSPGWRRFINRKPPAPILRPSATKLSSSARST